MRLIGARGSAQGRLGGGSGVTGPPGDLASELVRPAGRYSRGGQRRSGPRRQAATATIHHRHDDRGLSPDALGNEFVLRQGTKLHNGHPKWRKPKGR
jgi:hypothetical protein